LKTFCTTMEAPPGVYPTDSRVPTVIGVTSFVLSVAFLAVSIRIYIRLYVLRQFGVDDWAAVFAFFLVLGCGFAVAWNVRNGLGHHVYFLTSEQIKSYMRTFYVTIVFYNAALAGIKMTFLFQYYRVLAVQKMKNVFIGAMVIVGAWSISQILLEIFICTPIPAFWDKSVGGTCIPNYPQWYINAAGNIITDIIVFVLPLPVIHRLKLARGQKYVLLGIFCLGFFTCTISFIRIRFLKLEENFTWQNVETAGWSIGELCCGLTCACLPTFRPLVSRFVPALSSRVTKSSKYNPHGDYSKNTGSTSQPRDLELGGGTGNPGRYSTRNPKQRTESLDSKTDLYGMATYDMSHADSSREGSFPIQGPKALERQNSTAENTPPLMQRQESIEMGGYGTNNGAVVETHIEGGPRISNDKIRLQPGAPIEVTCDIVQISSQRVEERGFT
ncbi:integral membrane protein, partial [Colletotrichum tofieldiae]